MIWSIGPKSTSKSGITSARRLPGIKGGQVIAHDFRVWVNSESMSLDFGYPCCRAVARLRGRRHRLGVIHSWVGSRYEKGLPVVWAVIARELLASASSKFTR